MIVLVLVTKIENSLLSLFQMCVAYESLVWWHKAINKNRGHGNLLDLPSGH